MEMDPPPPVHATGRRRCREYVLALEEERRKIQVFQRELPLCLDLVTQTIERMRSQMDGVGSEETVSDHGPVLEEFMPLKPSLSLSSSEEHDSARDAGGVVVGKKEEDAPETRPADAKRATPDWLQSVQLWSQEPQHQRASSPHKELPCKPVALNARKAGGAFQPFEKEKRGVELPSSSTTAAASSAVVGDSSGDNKAASVDDDDTEKHNSDKQEEASNNKDAAKGKDKEGQSSSSNRKPRRCWAPELHRRFLQALQQLGGSHVATPKQIRELMKVDGLTNDEVKSHLQKYRLHARRPNSTVQSSSASAAPPAPQFVVVGGIWVPPPEYAAAAAAAAAAAQPPVQLAADASGSASTVYAPVATLPSGAQPQSQQKQQLVQRQPSRCSDGRRSGSTGDASSASPAVSSSSQTTSA